MLTVPLNCPFLIAPSHFYNVYILLKVKINTKDVSLNSSVRHIVLNATFNNVSVISWRSVLLVEETGVPGENYRPVACH